MIKFKKIEFKKIDKTLENADLVCTKTDGTPYHFNLFFLLLKFIEKIHNYEITLDEAINDQTKLNILINKLNNEYNPRNPEKVKEKKEVLESARKLQDAKNDITDLFEKGIFRIGVIYLKQKKNQKKTNFLNILRINQKVLTMFFLVIILIF